MQGSAVGVRAGLRQTETPDTRSLASGESGRRDLIFVDEIHRFNKSQQDALLPFVESGVLTLIAATTENPSFEVISPLLSRSQVYRMLPLSDEQIRQIVERALTADEILQKKNIHPALRAGRGIAPRRFFCLSLVKMSPQQPSKNVPWD